MTGIVPTNAYPCLPDPKTKAPIYVVIGGNGDSIYKRLMNTIGREDLTGPRYERNAQRVQRQREIEDAISSWTSQRTIDEVLKEMTKAGVPVGRVATMKEVAESEQLAARGAIQEVEVKTKNKDGEEKEWSVKMLGTFPVIDGVDAKPRWAGPQLGAHTEEILREELGLRTPELNRLRREGIIG